MSAFAIHPSLKGKTEDVTGRDSGTGVEIVRAFGAQGARVGFVDLNEDALQSLLDNLVGDYAFAPVICAECFLEYRRKQLA